MAKGKGQVSMPTTCLPAFAKIMPHSPSFDPLTWASGHKHAAFTLIAVGTCTNRTTYLRADLLPFLRKIASRNGASPFFKALFLTLKARLQFTLLSAFACVLRVVLVLCTYE